ncbi:hypothetical protein CYMTET_16738 [Cymbomonas tetramitiformis]|uniref:Uncharacterized protein n=1 Tax=Cymbomonas tetramitiformis TaxID=36881 RepID=A0AAE0GCS7_9CHLO|nr:hypothetical protein CYMTET_16738 [Cymbomonas tetramitiformis]
MGIEYGEDDGQAKKHDKQNWSTRFGAMRSADLPPKERVKMKHCGVISIAPGPRQHWKDVDVLLEPMMEELKQLSKGHADADQTPFRVYDGYFQVWHEQLSVFLMLCYCNTIARNDLGKFAPVAARRNDFKSIWEATKGPNGNGMYCLGYANPISQTYLDEGEVLYANDPSVWLTKEDHKELVRLTAEDGVDPMRTGRYAAGPLEQLDSFDPIYGYVMPFMHMMCYGVIKKFLKMLRNKVNNCPNTCYFSPMQLKQLQANGKRLTAPHDMHREYQDFVQYAGNYTMEDMLNFILIFSPMVFMDVLKNLNPELDKAWWTLRRAVLYFMRGPAIGLCGDLQSRAEPRKETGKELWAFAVIVEQQCPMNMLTLNLRMAVVHLCKQEEETGVVSSTNELWVERLLGDSKGVVPAPVGGKAIDTCIANAYLTKEAVDDMAWSYEGIRFLPDMLTEMAMAKGGEYHDSGTTRADGSSKVCHLLDTGHYLVVRDGVPTAALANEEGGRLHRELVGCVRSLFSDHASPSLDAAMTVLRFSRMRRGDKDFTSRVYTRAKTRISFNVALSTCAADAFEYGTVEAYYLIFLKRSAENSAANDTVCRLAMVTAYPTVEDLTMNEQPGRVCVQRGRKTYTSPTGKPSRNQGHYPSPTWKPRTSTRHLPMAGDESGTLQEAIAQATSSAPRSNRRRTPNASAASSAPSNCSV